MSQREVVIIIVAFFRLLRLCADFPEKFLARFYYSTVYQDRFDINGTDENEFALPQAENIAITH